MQYYFFNIGVSSLRTDSIILDNKTLCINNLYPLKIIVDYRQRSTT